VEACFGKEKTCVEIIVKAIRTWVQSLEKPLEINAEDCSESEAPAASGSILVAEMTFKERNEYLETGASGMVGEERAKSRLRSIRAHPTRVRPCWLGS